LKVDEERLAQVVADTLAKYTDEVNEGENGGGLDQDEQAVAGEDGIQTRDVTGDDSFINDLLAELGEIGIEDGNSDE